jgi:hypothetical protein
MPAPAPCTLVLGFSLDLRRQMVALPIPKIEALLRAVTLTLTLPAPSAAYRASLLGALVATAPGYRWARCHLSGILQALRLLLQRPTGSLQALHTLRHSREAYAKRAPLTPAERQDLTHWRQSLQHLLLREDARWHPGVARSAHPPRTTTASLVLATDASTTGFGAVLMMESASRPAPMEAPAVSRWEDIRAFLRPQFRHLSAREVESRCALRGTWGPTHSSHITKLEMLAAVQAILHLHRYFDLTNKHLFVLTDASAVRSTLHRAGSVRPQMMQAFAPLQKLLQSTGATLTAGHIRGVANLWADRLSRQRASPSTLSLWSPHPRSLSTARLSAQYHPWFLKAHTVDLFASPQDRVCPKFLSYEGTQGAWAADAMTADWSRLASSGALYIFPPPPLLDRVATRLIALSPIPFTLVAPLFPHQRWYKLLMGTLPHLSVRTLPSDAILYATGAPVKFPGVWITLSSLKPSTPAAPTPLCGHSPA